MMFLIEKEAQLKEDEQLAIAIQQSLNLEGSSEGESEHDSPEFEDCQSDHEGDEIEDSIPEQEIEEIEDSVPVEEQIEVQKCLLYMIYELFYNFSLRKMISCADKSAKKLPEL